MAVARVNWVTDPVQVWMPAYRQWAADITEVVEDVLRERADEIEQWMKASHIWKNRTTVAEHNLSATVARDGFRVMLIMYHGSNVPYSRFLERYMQSGRFSVLTPAMLYWGPILLDDVRKALK